MTRAFFFVLIFISQVAYSQSGWVLKKEKNGIFIYGLKKDTSDFNSIKVETELKGKAEDLLSIILDVENHNKWAYGTKSATVLKRISEKEIIFYKELKSPALVSDRDIVVQLKVLSIPAVNSIKIESIALPDFIPAKKNLVRVPKSNETWIIKQSEAQKIKVSYYLQIDPGGTLPPLLVNLFIDKGPYETFEKLRELLVSSH